MEFTKNQLLYFNSKTYHLTLVTYLSLLEIQKIISDDKKIKHWAYCVHDKDNKKTHTHVMLSFTSDQTLLKWAKLFDTSEITPLKKEELSYMFRYLIHDTQRAKNEGKFQYGLNERFTDDYQYFAGNVKDYSKNVSRNISELLTDVLSMTRRQFAVKYGITGIVNYDKFRSFAVSCEREECYLLESCENVGSPSTPKVC